MPSPYPSAAERSCRNRPEASRPATAILGRLAMRLTIASASPLGDANSWRTQPREAAASPLRRRAVARPPWGSNGCREHMTVRRTSLPQHSAFRCERLCQRVLERGAHIVAGLVDVALHCPTRAPTIPGDNALEDLQVLFTRAAGAVWHFEVDHAEHQ